MSFLHRLFYGLCMVCSMGISQAYALGPSVPVTLLYDHTSLIVGTVHSAQVAAYTYETEMTRVEREGRIDFIDYKNLLLYRYKRSERECTMYQLTDPAGRVEDMGNEYSHILAKAEAIGSVDVLGVASEDKFFRGYPVRGKKIIWGAAAAKRRTVANPSIAMYGQLFTPTVGEYKVTSAIERVDDLFRLAAAHEAIFRANPLLRLLDPLGVLRELRGIPVMIKTDGFREELRDIRRGERGGERILLPVPCRTEKKSVHPATP